MAVTNPVPPHERDPENEGSQPVSSPPLAVVGRLALDTTAQVLADPDVQPLDLANAANWQSYGPSDRLVLEVLLGSGTEWSRTTIGNLLAETSPWLTKAGRDFSAGELLKKIRKDNALGESWKHNGEKGSKRRYWYEPRVASESEGAGDTATIVTDKLGAYNGHQPDDLQAASGPVADAIEIEARPSSLYPAPRVPAAIWAILGQPRPNLIVGYALPAHTTNEPEIVNTSPNALGSTDGSEGVGAESLPDTTDSAVLDLQTGEADPDDRPGYIDETLEDQDLDVSTEVDDGQAAPEEPVEVDGEKSGGDTDRPKQRFERLEPVRFGMVEIHPDDWTTAKRRESIIRILNLESVADSTSSLPERFRQHMNRLEIRPDGKYGRASMNGYPLNGPVITELLNVLLATYLLPPFSLEEAHSKYGLGTGLEGDSLARKLEAMHGECLRLMTQGVVGYDLASRSRLFLAPLTIQDSRRRPALYRRVA